VVLRLFFQPPVEVVQTVKLTEGGNYAAEFTMSAELFRR